jgi:hypothetical protein
VGKDVLSCGVPGGKVRSGINRAQDEERASYLLDICERGNNSILATTYVGAREDVVGRGGACLLLPTRRLPVELCSLRHAALLWQWYLSESVKIARDVQYVK